MNKDVVKYALMAVAAYLVYKYIQDNGGFEALLGTAKAPAPGPVAADPNAHMPGTLSSELDTTGLTVVRDVNGSLTGTVKIHGQPVRLAIIQSDGRIFDSMGTEVTQKLISQGIDVDKLRAAFTAAGAGLAGLSAFAPAYRAAVWLN